MFEKLLAPGKIGKKPLADLEEPLRKQFGKYFAIGDARGRSNICTEDLDADHELLSEEDIDK